MALDLPNYQITRTKKENKTKLNFKNKKNSASIRICRFIKYNNIDSE